jgi:hypothetical protein
MGSNPVQVHRFKKELLTKTFAQNMEIVRFPQLFEMVTINIATSQTVL